MPLHPGLRACGAQGARGTCRVGRGFTAARRKASQLAGLAGVSCQLIRKKRHLAESLMAQQNSQREKTRWLFLQGDALHLGLRGLAAQGTLGTCEMASVLPPLGGRPCGSRVWQGACQSIRKKPPIDGESYSSKTASVPRNAGCFLYCWKIIPNFDVPAVPLEGFRRFGHSGSRNRRRCDPYIPRVPALPRPGWGNRSGRWSPWR